MTKLLVRTVGRRRDRAGRGVALPVPGGSVMTKLLMVLSAIVTIGVVGAPVASADESGFIEAIDSLGHYALEAPGTIGDALDVGYRACAAFGQGGKQAAIQTVLDAYNADTSESADYYATLFAQYAAFNLCPAHDGEIGPI